tara:strand:- start:44108 stop:45751 length:1644 start_codon:yes stop_codon:yes gene_type:complete
MSLIEIDGKNPFSGQKDPYVSMDSSISYDEDSFGIVKNTYTLNGALTGCSSTTLASRRDQLAAEFDWKANPSITSGISISGLVTASPKAQLIPLSLSFESTNYIGALPYTLTLEVFTGYDYDSNSEKLINKVHTESTTIDENGCVTINTNLACTPNQNLTGCGSLDAANNWIKTQLGVVKLGETTLSDHMKRGETVRTKDLELTNESLQINPITAEISYSNTRSSNCDNVANANAPQGGQGFQLAYCREDSIENEACSKSQQVVTVNHKGEVYKLSGTQDELMNYLATSQVLQGKQGVKNFNASYDNAGDSITFSFVTLEDGNGQPLYEPRDLTVNNYTLSYNENHDQGTITSSVDGNVEVVNPVNVDPKTVINNYDASSTKGEAQTLVGANAKLVSENESRDTQAGTLSYSYEYTNDNQSNNSDAPELDGYKGVSEYRIAFTPPIQQYETVANLNCDDLIFDKGYASRGQCSITINAVSGSGYDFQKNARDLKDDLYNKVAAKRSQSKVTSDKETLSDQQDSITIEYSATFKGDSVIDENDVESMK